MLDTKARVHLHEDDLELYLSGRLESELLLSTERHLEECKTCRTKLSNCLGQALALQIVGRAKTGAPQKRSEPRFSTAAGEGILQELHPLSMDRLKVKVVNLSKNGRGILSSRAILPGAIVQLRIKDSVELGSVRYCSAMDDNSFRIGLWLHGKG